MQTTREVTTDIIWVGANDRKLELFENLFPLPGGVSYNSYLIMDEKVALMDTVDAQATDQFLENIAAVLQGRTIDYLVIHHMEPDHAANVARLMQLYPALQVVGNQKTAKMIGQFFGTEPGERFLLVKEGDSLKLGRHELSFYMAPMVHWPEVMVSYDRTAKALFTADAFGTFGTLDCGLFADESDFTADFLDEARRYYANIVGKYGLQTQQLLKKAAKLEISLLLPLHGPVWREDLDQFLDKYDKWSRYEPEENGVCILVGSIYGHTAAAADALAIALKANGVDKVKLYDVSKTHFSYLISEIFKYSHLVFACATYNNGIFPLMANLLHDMQALGLQNRTAALIQNGTWAPQSGKLMRAELEKLKGFTVLDTQLNICSALQPEQSAELDALARAIIAAM